MQNYTLDTGVRQAIADWLLAHFDGASHTVDGVSLVFPTLPQACLVFDSVPGPPDLSAAGGWMLRVVVLPVRADRYSADGASGQTGRLQNRDEILLQLWVKADRRGGGPQAADGLALKVLEALRLLLGKEGGTETLVTRGVRLNPAPIARPVQDDDHVTHLVSVRGTVWTEI